MRLIAIAIACAPIVAHAQPAPDAPNQPVPTETPEPAPAPAPQPTAEPVPTPDELAARIDDLENALKKVQRAQRVEESTRAQVQTLLPLPRFINVFVDVGAFAVGGDGSGIRSDLDHLVYPQFAGRLAGQWVFMGDPLSTAINSLGEPADTSDSREIKTDTVHAGSHPSLIVNSLGLSIGRDVGHGFSIVGLAELLPRPGNTIVDTELAYIEYRPTEDYDVRFQAGKIDSVLGVEYRSQDAPRRLGVTPSLICRYTCGRPIGIAGRMVLGKLSASASITDRDNFDALFEPDTGLRLNTVPTAAGHLQWMLPVGQGLEVGVSGATGPQTGQPDNGVMQWHIGLDARLRDLAGFDATAEVVQGLQPGKTMTVPCDVAQCLDYKGAYLLVDRRMNTWLTPYVRVDWRDAVAQNGVNFVYESHTLRATIGAHVEVTSRIIGKIEYTFNHEVGPIPEFGDDILTSSFVVSTD